MMDTAPSNIPEYSVGEIAGAVKRTLEDAFGRVRVRGELSEVKRYASGHTYLAMKDEAGLIRGIIWKSALPRLGLKPEDGVEVIATGRISAWGDKSQYQIIIERLEYAGAGAMLARIEALKVRLAAEGLFGRHRELPVLPEVIGVVTSAQGAVLHDIATTVRRRCGRPILLWPVLVQGPGAAEQIAAAIAGFCALPSHGVRRPDVVIVARGGGSLEDLMAFNDEAVVRAAAGCSIPLISAVGHETDHTLIDLAADRRAPTPTAAAEMAVPARLELLAGIAQRSSRLSGAMARSQQERHMRLVAAAQDLPDVERLAEAARQRLDDRAHRLDLALPNLVAARRAALVRAELGLPDLPALLRETRQRVANAGVQLVMGLPALVAARRAALQQVAAAHRAGLLRALQLRQNTAARVLNRPLDTPVLAVLRERRARLDGLAAQLESVSPMAVLARGYALVEDISGHAVTSARSVTPGQALRIRFADDVVSVRADGPNGSARQGRLSL